MTMSSAVSKVTLNGDGVQTSWPFSFKVWKADDLEVILTSPEGTESVTTDWSVVLAGIGGTLTYPVLGYPLPTGWKITIRRSMDFLQEVDLVSGTRWDPEVVETALDQAAAERQQLREEISRAVRVGVASEEDPANVVNQVFTARDQAAASAGAAATSESNAAISAVEAQLAASQIGVLTAEGTLTTGQDTITLPFAYDFENEALAVYLGGIRQNKASLTFVDAYTVVLDTPVAADTDYIVSSVTLDGDAILTGLRDDAVAAKTGAETARTGAETAQAAAETARAGAEAALAATAASLRDLRAGDIVMRGHTTIRTLDDGLPEALELNGDVVSLSTFPRLERVWWGASLNATAPAFYRCNAAGTRDAAGTHIKFPDLRGYVPRGWDHGRGIDAGRILLSQQEDAIRNITGSFTRSSVNNAGIVDSAASLSGAFTTGTQRGYAVSGQSQTSFDIAFDASRVVPTAPENRMRNAALMFIIYV